MTAGRVRPIGRYCALACILLLAAGLRLAGLGAEPFHGDENYISLKVIGVVRHHQAEWLGPPMSNGLWHSPISIYLYALPFEISLDTRIGRTFTAVMNVLAVALLYVLAARAFGRRAGLAAALLYAVQPEAVNAARIINNAQIGAPFVMLYFATGLWGFQSNRRAARIAHLPALSLAGQCHPYSFALAPLSLLWFAQAWWQRPGQRRQLIGQFTVSALLAAALLLPWGIGLWQSGGGNIFRTTAGVTFRQNQDWQKTFEVLYGLVGGPAGVLRLINISLTGLGIGWVIVQLLRRKSEGLAGLLMLLGLLLIPAAAIQLNLLMVADYLWPVLPLAFAIQGAVIARLLPDSRPADLVRRIGQTWRPARIGRWVFTGLVAALVAREVWLLATANRAAEGGSLNSQYALMRSATDWARQTNRPILAMTPARQDITLHWEVLREIAGFNDGQEVLVVPAGRAMPLPAAGAVLVGPVADQQRPYLFSGGSLIDGFRLSELPPADQFTPDLLPLAPLHFSNHTTVLGFRRARPDSLPAAGQTWTLFMLWRVDAVSDHAYTLFVHLIDETGGKFAQLDLPGLPAGQQAPGEYALSQFDLQLGNEFPASGPLYLRFGMYDAGQQAGVVDADGKPLGDFGLIQVRGLARPVAAWPDGLILDHLTTNSPLEQGPPLEVTATWQLMSRLGRDLRLEWRLLNESEGSAFSQTTDLIPGVAAANLPAGLFAPAAYHLRIPTDLAPGAYQLEARLVGPANQPVGQPYRTAIEVTARQRRFVAPPLAHPINAQFGGLIKLVGYDLKQDGRILQITLHWQADGPILRDYKYFVHVWQNQHVVAQVDAMPDAYQYLTSWWAPGEVVSEPIRLDLGGLQPGPCLLTTGFYDPASSQRLPVTLADGQLTKNAWVTLQDIDLR